jgi:hypothetical protein
MSSPKDFAQRRNSELRRAHKNNTHVSAIPFAKWVVKADIWRRNVVQERKVSAILALGD